MEWMNLTKVMEGYAGFLQDTNIRNMPKEWGLRDNFIFEMEINGTLYEIKFMASEYWKYANYGRRPGKMPPFNKISDWITRRKIVPYPMKNGKLPTHRQLTFLISRKIGRDGVKGKGFLEKTLEDSRDYWESQIEQAIANDIQREMQSWLSPLNGPVSL